MSCQQAEHQRQKLLKQRDGLQGEFPAYAGFVIHTKPKGYVAASNLQHLTQCLGIIYGSPLFSIQTDIQHELLGKSSLNLSVELGTTANSRSLSKKSQQFALVILSTQGEQKRIRLNHHPHQAVKMHT